MALVKCEATEGPRPGYKAVGVVSVEGHTEWLAIEDRFISWRDEKPYLPVAVVGKDSRYKTVLVQLPLEADSGARRVWVRAADVVQEDEVPA